MSVLDKLDQLYNWWFDPVNNIYWFNSAISTDKIIAEKFGELIDQIKIKPENLTLNQSIGYILIHDQVVRHWVRHQQVEFPELIIENHFKKIHDFVNNFYSNNKQNINGYDFCFTLLPLRHTNDYFKIRFVLEETWKKLEQVSDSELKKIYSQYLKATYSRAKYKLVSEKKDLLLVYNESTDNIHEKIEDFVIKYSDVLDSNSKYNYNSNYKNYSIDTCPIAKECLKISKSIGLIVSISGGVDSMVVAWVLKKLGYNIIFVHINYANRSNTDLEQNLVESWGKYLGVRVFYRKLDEINRPKCMEYELRSVYETYTRDQRYQAYSQSAKIMGWSDYKVVLGHNHDDCIENIFTNITSKTKYDNLYGMEFESEICFNQDKINFIRPMLSISKQQIYQIAKENNILYLWDSTPKWSQRGKLRDLVRPALIEFNPEVLEGFNKLVKVLGESMNCVDQLVNSYTNLMVNQELEIKIHELNENYIFWNKFIENLGIRISDKCLENLIDKIRRFKLSFETKQLNFIEKFQLNKNKKIGFKKINSTSMMISFI